MSRKQTRPNGRLPGQRRQQPDDWLDRYPAEMHPAILAAVERNARRWAAFKPILQERIARYRRSEDAWLAQDYTDQREKDWTR